MKKLILSYKAIYDLIIEPEVTSKSHYNAYLKSPVWPGHTSGITIGLGYDLGMQTPAQIAIDWKDILPKETVDRLKKYSGILGTACKKYLKECSDIVVTWEQGCKVFYNTTLKRYARDTASIYPELEEIHPYEQTAFVGLVYNRGKSLKVTDDRRKEMRQLVQAIKDDNDKLMASLLRQMKRLWEDKGLGGLLKRRELEAVYVEKIDTPIPENDMLVISI